MASLLVFDSFFYLYNYPDLGKAGIHDYNHAKQHWLNHGIQEGRQGCGSFHSVAYIARYPDVPHNYTEAIAHYLVTGHLEHRLGYMESGTNGRWTISNQRDLFISVSKRMGGSIDSLVWNNIQFINMYDHGRELQMAANTLKYGECYNPTEAGGRDDGRTLTTMSEIQSIHASGNVLQTSVRPAFWLRAHSTHSFGTGACGHGSSALNEGNTYPYTFEKKVTIGVDGNQQAIEFISNFTLGGQWPSDGVYVQMEAPTGYLTREFSVRHQFDQQHGHIVTYDRTRQHYPVVLATTDGRAAMGVFAPEGQDNDNGHHTHYEGGMALGSHGYIDLTNKWSVVFRKHVRPGVHHQVYRTYLCVGTLSMVSSCLQQLTSSHSHSMRDL